MKGLIKHAQGTVTAKVLFVGFLILLLLIPVNMIENLIGERHHMLESARSEIARAWGGEQVVGGPILIVPFQYSRYLHNGVSDTVSDEIFVLPDELSIQGELDTQTLRRGLYTVPVYTASLSVTGRLSPPDIDRADYDDLEILWHEARFSLPLSDARSIKNPVRLTLGDTSIEFQPGGNPVAGFGQQLIAPFAALGLENMVSSQAFSFDLTLGGSGSLKILPLGDTTRVNLQSGWPSPSFSGAYLPDERTVSDSGFSASWRVLNLGRGYPESWKRSENPGQRFDVSSFGVELMIPVGIHAASLRAVKYAVLFIGLTFLGYFLFEIFASLRLHALQYLLVGMANCIFYLLLLALAEYIGFGPAYAGSALASVALIGSYSAAILASARRALPVVSMLAAIYFYLYITLQAEDLALLFGALGLFGILATFMYLTRRVDWFAVSFNVDSNSASAGGNPPSSPA